MDLLKFKFLEAVLWDWQGTILDESEDIICDSLFLLQQIKNLGISQGVITNGDGIKIRSQCINIGFSVYFDLGVISRFDGYKPKPSTEMFDRILIPIGGYNVKNILFIGDSEADRRMAQKGGCRFMYPWDIRISHLNNS